MNANGPDSPSQWSRAGGSGLSPTSLPPVIDGPPPLDPPRRLPAGSAVTWLTEGWELFRESPAIWVAIVVVWVVLSGLLAAVPLLPNLLAPVLVAGLMLGSHTLARGEGLALETLFAGFRRNFGALLMTGLLTLALTLAAVLLLFIFVAVAAATAGVGLEELAAANIDTVDNPGVSLALIGFGLFLFLTCALVIAMATWFAPALVAINGLRAAPAMLLSLRGCFANLLPFLVYGLIVLVLGVLATVPFFLGWLVLGPVVVTSTYAAYREIFTP